MKNYPAIMYYENHPTKDGVYQIHICFNDLRAAGLPSSTVGNSPTDAIEAAREFLSMMLEYAEEQGIQVPEPTPIEKLKIDRGSEGLSEPFKIVIENIAA